MNAETRLVAMQLIDAVSAGRGAYRLAEQLKHLIDAADIPPPNTVRARIPVDVPPGCVGSTGVVVPHAGERCPSGWLRSVVVADVRVPEPIAEIVGAVEVP